MEKEIRVRVSCIGFKAKDETKALIPKFMYPSKLRAIAMQD